MSTYLDYNHIGPDSSVYSPLATDADRAGSYSSQTNDVTADLDRWVIWSDWIDSSSWAES